MKNALTFALLLAALPAAHADTDFDACLARLRGEAASHQVSTDTFDRLTAGLAPDPTVLEALDRQPEFVTPIWDYLAALVDDERIADGKAMLGQWREVLDKVEAEYGVDPATVVAVWGVESNFGRNFGSRSLITSLATLSCEGRRQSYFRGEFFTTLQIVQAGHIAPERLTGSWAGAFGHTQFMPSTFMRVAVDFDGDGRRDLIDSVPDALASTANYLKRAGWRTGEPWGYEVRLPAGFDASVTGRKARRPLAEWVRLGVRRVDGTAIAPDDTSAALLLPAGVDGPAFMVFRNFHAIYSYNAAESYALAIAHLSDRLRGGQPFVTAWPTDDPGIGRNERRELQTLLLARGHDIGEVDGMIGSRTRQAIAAEQTRLGFDANGRAGRKILDALRAGH
ncbi:lytic murein transglycosylase [Denitromonas iodatirespirans]|uniref:Lytic murein transglycosylase n=1 Tax=Denitromonas iodatirespirans TaxID=2795389 RepID=A0A944D8A4_DENI1|nr:lytic murein transglycosylase [Denitromonas iodatirespirans]MBT0961799.1 lytic murein transglycosylase [Denitromonas iodatirespirans]